MSTSSHTPFPAGVEIGATVTQEFAEILAPEVLTFLAKLQRTFGARREELLHKRRERQQALDSGQPFDFLPETAEIRAGDWTIAPTPAGIQDRRVEITGPTDRKM